MSYLTFQISFKCESPSVSSFYGSPHCLRIFSHIWSVLTFKICCFCTFCCCTSWMSSQYDNCAQPVQLHGGTSSDACPPCMSTTAAFCLDLYDLQLFPSVGYFLKWCPNTHQGAKNTWTTVAQLHLEFKLPSPIYNTFLLKSITSQFSMNFYLSKLRLEFWLSFLPLYLFQEFD